MLVFGPCFGCSASGGAPCAASAPERLAPEPQISCCFCLGGRWAAAATLCLVCVTQLLGTVTQTISS